MSADWWGCLKLSTFSNRKPFGSASPNTRRNCDSKLRGSRSIHLFAFVTQYPFLENGWQGGPPITIRSSASSRCMVKSKLQISSRSINTPSVLLSRKVSAASESISTARTMFAPASFAPRSSPPAPENKLIHCKIRFFRLRVSLASWNRSLQKILP